MMTRRWTTTAVFLSLVIAVPSLMGGGCTINLGGLFPDIDRGYPYRYPTTVMVELRNFTEYDVDPGLYVDPDTETGFFNPLISDENFIELDPPVVFPGEVVTLEFACRDIGTIISDFARQVLSGGFVESLDDPMLIYGADFTCGDIITFDFTYDNRGDFSTFVNVSRQPMTF